MQMYEAQNVRIVYTSFFNMKEKLIHTHFYRPKYMHNNYLKKKKTLTPMWNFKLSIFAWFGFFGLIVWFPSTSTNP